MSSLNDQSFSWHRYTSSTLWLLVTSSDFYYLQRSTLSLLAAWNFWCWCCSWFGRELNFCKQYELRGEQPIPWQRPQRTSCNPRSGSLESEAFTLFTKSVETGSNRPCCTRLWLITETRLQIRQIHSFMTFLSSQYLYAPTSNEFGWSVQKNVYVL
jgi:hypothetical protein